MIQAVEYNNNFTHDIVIGNQFESLFGKMVAHYKIECKADFLATTTGNFYIEYNYKDQPSGILKSEARLYCLMQVTKGINRELQEGSLYTINDIDFFYIIQTGKLLSLCRKHGRKVQGGDGKNTKGWLLKKADLVL